MSTCAKSGPSKTSIQIRWNGGDAATNLQMLADVRPFFIVDSSALKLGPVGAGEERSCSVGLRTRLQRRVMLRTTKGIPAGARVSLNPVDPDRFGRSASWKVAVLVSGDDYRGPKVFCVGLESDQFVDGHVERVFTTAVAVDLRAEQCSTAPMARGTDTGRPSIDVD